MHALHRVPTLFGAGIGVLAIGLTLASADAAQVTTYAGSGAAGIADGPAAQAQFIAPFGVAWGPGRRLYVTDSEAQRVRVVLPDGIVKTVAGSGAVARTGLAVAGGYADGPGATARFDLPTGIVVDPAGRILVTDTGNRCIRAIDRDGRVTTLAGDLRRSGAHDGPPALASFEHPTGIALGPRGSLFVADGSAGVRQIAADGTVSTLSLPFGDAFGIASWLAGDGVLDVTNREGLWTIDLAAFAAGKGAVSRFRPGMMTLQISPPLPGVNELVARGQHSVGVPFGVSAFDETGIAFTDVLTHTVRYADPLTQNIDVIGGRAIEDAAENGGGFADGPAEQSRFDEPTGVAVAPDGTVAVADAGNKRIRLIREVDRSVPFDPMHDTLGSARRRGEYRIGFIGSSLVWGSGSFSVSPAAAIERRLSADRALTASAKVARVVTVRMNSDVAPLRSYVDLVAEAHLFDTVVILVSDFDARDSYPALITGAPLADTAPRWTPRLTTDLAAVKSSLDAAGIPSLFVAVPLANELGLTEAAAAEIVEHPHVPADDVIAPDGRLERLATAPLVDAKLNWLDGWAIFERDMRSPGHRPLFLSVDGHFTAYGNQILGNAIAARLEADHPWSRSERHP
jgi:DNA-binding beta-propeller fold protein YncE